LALSLNKDFALSFFIQKEDCTGLYKKHSQQLSKAKKTFSLKQEEKLLQKLDTCSTEKQVWLLIDLLLKNSLRQGLVLKQKEIEERAADLAYYQWKNYQKAIQYYTELLKKPLKKGELFLFQYQMASSYFKLAKTQQALIELEKTFFEGISRKERRKAFQLKLQIFILQKNFSSSIELTESLLIEFPEDKDSLRETLAALYEYQKEFSKAIEELKKIEKQQVFTEQKIKRLEERQSNQP